MAANPLLEFDAAEAPIPRYWGGQFKARIVAGNQRNPALELADLRHVAPFFT
jgi:hypothetical protein